jgi:hypothetical protein
MLRTKYETPYMHHVKHYKATHETWHMQHGHAIKETYNALMKHYYATYETCDCYT